METKIINPSPLILLSLSTPDATEGDDTTLYLWGMGGNRTMLPPNTGFKVIHSIIFRAVSSFNYLLSSELV